MVLSWLFRLVKLVIASSILTRLWWCGMIFMMGFLGVMLKYINFANQLPIFSKTSNLWQPLTIISRHFGMNYLYCPSSVLMWWHEIVYWHAASGIADAISYKFEQVLATICCQILLVSLCLRLLRHTL